MNPGGNSMPLKKRPFEYKWVILILSFLMVFFCCGVCLGNKSLYFAAVTEAMGFKRSVYSLSGIISLVPSAIANLYFGYLIYRFGPKALIVGGIVVSCVGFWLYSVSESIWGFFLAGVIVSVGSTYFGTSVASTLIKRWFSNNVGTFTGIVLAANGFGSALAAQIVTPMLIDPGNPFGFRNVYRMFIPLLLVLGILFLIFIRNQPADGPCLPAPEVKKRQKGAPKAKGSTHKPDLVFCFISAAIFLFFMLIQSVYGTYAVYMKDAGLSAAQIATVASILTLCLAASKMIVGFLFDKWGLFPVLAMCMIAFIVSICILLCLPLAPSAVLGILFAVLIALSMPLETVCIALIVSEFSAREAFEKRLGIVSAVGSIGSAIGSPLLNLCYDISGSYTLVLIIWAVLMLLVLLGFYKLASRPKEISATNNMEVTQ